MAQPGTSPAVFLHSIWEVAKLSHHIVDANITQRGVPPGIISVTFSPAISLPIPWSIWVWLAFPFAIRGGHFSIAWWHISGRPTSVSGRPSVISHWRAIVPSHGWPLIPVAIESLLHELRSERT